MLARDIIEALRGISGQDNVSVDEAARTAYSYDATRLKGMPEVIVRPGSEEEVASVVRLAAKHGVPIVPRGAGSGLSGGSVAVMYYQAMQASFNRGQNIDRIDIAAAEGQQGFRDRLAARVREMTSSLKQAK